MTEHEDVRTAEHHRLHGISKSFRFIDVDPGQSLELSQRLSPYAYDAYVLACALNSRSPLLTLDRKLAAAAAAGVRIVEAGP